MIRYMKKGQDILFFSGDIQIARLIGYSDAKDTLTILEDGIFEWRRQCKPVKKMCMELETCYSSEFYLIPGINYNGNGFGTFCEYEGDRYNGVPWVYGWHRAAIPAMTMSQDEKISVSLIGKANDGESCSLFYKKDSKQMVPSYFMARRRVTKTASFVSVCRCIPDKDGAKNGILRMDCF